MTYGCLSSTLAAGKLFKLSHEQVVHALGIAGTTSAALRLTRAGELSMWKGCAFAHAARNGVFAAMLAEAGMTGPAPLFEGDMGFFQQISGSFNLDQLGGTTLNDWMLPKTSIKFVPAEYHSQSAIAAALELRPKIVDPSQIDSIEIFTFKTAVEIIGRDPEKWSPKTRETADHSLPYCTAVALSTARSPPRSSLPNVSPTPPCSPCSRARPSSKTSNSPGFIPRAFPTSSAFASRTARPSKRASITLPATTRTP